MSNKPEFKCPKCGYEIGIEKHELWNVYGDGSDLSHDCPSCCTPLLLRAVPTGYTFECEIDEDLAE